MEDKSFMDEYEKKIYKKNTSKKCDSFWKMS